MILRSVIRADTGSRAVFVQDGLLRMERSEVSGNCGAGVHCEVTTPVAITNSIIWGNTTGAGPIQVGGSCTVSYSNVEGGVTSEPPPGLTAGPRNVDTNPLFVNPAAEDFRIRPESSAIDAADPEATLEVDFDENPRPVGSGHDIGAYEVQ